MKKIILSIISIFILYVISIFALPSVSGFIGDNLGLSGFNKNVIKIRDDFNDFITNLDIFGKYEETKKEALEIKQNIETQVQETKDKIEVIQTNVEETKKSIENTTKAVNETVDSINELQNNIKNVVPSGKNSSGIINSGSEK